MFICQIYMDDILFGATNLSLNENFGDLMQGEYEISMI